MSGSVTPLRAGNGSVVRPVREDRRALDGDDRTARAVWSALVEPGDRAAGLLLAAHGAPAALAGVRAAVGAASGAGSPEGVVARLVEPLGEDDRRGARRALARWAVRLPGLAPDGGLRDHLTAGGRLVVPGDEDWPPGLDDLRETAPPALWVRGTLPAAGRRAVALVGARAATPYGEHVASRLAGDLARAGLVVVSGGAYGIDAAAHRGALAAGGTTLVVVAGGVDRPYPAGNARLLAAAVEQGGAVLAEVPPGALPTRTRFLQRNRLIAAIAGATVVVEAAWRSGALSTARHAAGLLRPVGAVPGPVTSAASAGCHRIVREEAATLVTDADDVRELVEPVGTVDAPDAPPDTGAPLTGAPATTRGPEDVDPVAARVHDALPRRVARPDGDVAAAAGVTLREAQDALAVLELGGWAQRTATGWRAAVPT
ncbi:DNA-processing protein DprA [Cellulomonas marina]|uniref:DNA processing protein n=1 Tax=Cellulomonas marina TaxID=988821 RepID=A0A1I0VGW3_9CELL|nr:DNA-processing protein DprA [Cellulomonas marina]GIG28009.1 DNA processing protein DprA [Cellulomonas marina]SFA74816.1 DNA processing protein [Cellulomonas marina]